MKNSIPKKIHNDLKFSYNKTNPPFLLVFAFMTQLSKLQLSKKLKMSHNEKVFYLILVTLNWGPPIIHTVIKFHNSYTQPPKFIPNFALNLYNSYRKVKSASRFTIHTINLASGFIIHTLCCNQQSYFIQYF